MESVAYLSAPLTPPPPESTPQSPFDSPAGTSHYHTTPPGTGPSLVTPPMMDGWGGGGAHAHAYAALTPVEHTLPSGRQAPPKGRRKASGGARAVKSPPGGEGLGIAGEI
jgi:hypothetical protein